ncbi:hypothetical protein [Daejeonia sp. YH14]|uniref:hypothetical protein n=1 Tax=Daejeonia sp. YH14 TaxID=3439042 RepID=UPI003F493935
MNQTIRTFSIDELNPIITVNLKSENVKNNKQSEENKLKSQYTVLIQQSLLKDLEGYLIEHNKTYKELKLDYLVYYASLLNSLPSQNRSDDESDFYNVSLDSKLLKKIYSGYSKCMDFLKIKGCIKLVTNYSVDKKKCKQYKLADKYVGDQLIEYTITNRNLLKNLNNKIESEKMLYCIRKRPHLIKYFDEWLKIDCEKAEAIISGFLKTNYDKYVSGKHILKEFVNQDWKYSVKHCTDDRLHSSLTRLNKQLRNTVTYKNENLCAVDIKTSQPFFLVVLLIAILKKDRELFEKIGATKVLSDEMIDRLLLFNYDRNNIIEFINIVLNGDFYINFSQSLDIEYNTENKPFRIVVNYENKKRKIINYSKPQRNETYETDREFAKSVIMEILFCSPNHNFIGTKAFKKSFPCVLNIMNFIKKECVELHTLLTNIESHCLLDVVALEFAKKYPDIPIWSIHDALVTTESNINLLKDEVEKGLREITTIKTLENNNIIVKEIW